MTARLTDAGALMRAVLALVALALATPAAAATYGFQQNNSTSLGTNEGTANLPAGNTTQPTNFLWKTTASTSAASNAATQMRSTVTPAATWTSIARVYLPVYSVATWVASPSANISVSSSLANSANEQFQVLVKDFDPAGAALNGTTLFTSNQANSPSISTTAGTQLTLTWTGAGATVPAGHRLVVEILFKAATSNAVGRVFLTTSTTTNSRFTVTETAATTTLGDGAAVSGGPLGAGATAVLDSFSLQTNVGSDPIGSLTLRTPSGTAGLASVSIHTASTCLATNRVGSAFTALADGDNVVPTTGLSATTTLTTYYVCATAKAATAMPAPPGATYAITGTVVALASANAQAGTDGNAGTLTIDNLSPSNPTGFAGTAGNNRVDLAWTNPTDPDFAGTAVLRWTGAAGTQVPAEGSTYSVGGTIGAATVVCVTAAPGTSCPDATAANGSSYTYKIFARDTLANWSTGAAAGPLTPSGGTTTLGDATTSEPPSRSVAPGAAAVAVDAFSLVTTAGTDPVSAVAVSIPTGTAGLESVSIQNASTCDMAVPYGTRTALADGSNTVSVTGLTVTNAAAILYVCVKPRTPALMPLPPGAIYTVNAAVTGLTSQNTRVGGDSGAATITIDNQSPAAPGAFAGTAGTNTVALSWTNPADADLVETVVLRWTGSAGADVPAEGKTNYVAGNTINAATVACVVAKPGTTCSDAGALGGATYAYRAFARDTLGNYSVAASAGPFTPAGSSTVVGTGTDPASATVAPGAAATALDAFTLQTNGLSDGVGSVTVTLSAGATGVESLSIQDVATCTMPTPLGTLAAPVAGANAVPVSGLTATSTLASYWVCVKPKAQASLPLPPGSTYVVTGTVTLLASSFTKSYGDTGPTTLTIDNLSPSAPAALSGTIGNGSVYLAWTPPADADLAETVVLRWSGGAAGSEVPAEGSAYAAGSAIGTAAVACAAAKPATSCFDYGVVNGGTYVYKAFARDASRNYSSGVVTGPLVPAVVDTTVGVATATANACTQVAVSAPFTGDVNGNGSVTVSRGTSSRGPWTSVCADVGGASPRTCADAGALPNATNWYQVAFADPDGLSGASPQVVSAATPQCPDQLAVSAGVMPAGTAIAAGSSGAVVGRVVLTAQANSVTVTSLAVQNLGTAAPGGDVTSLGLYNDASNAFLGTSTWSAATSRYVFGGLALTVTAGTPVTLRVTMNPSVGATAGDTFRMQVTSPADVGVAAPDVAGAATVAGNAAAFTMAANTVLEGSTSSAAPMVSIVNPLKGAAVSLAPAGTPGGAGFKVQLRVFDPAGVAGITAGSVQVSTDNGATWSTTATRNARYDSGGAPVTGTVYEAVLTPAPGQYTLRARASNGTVQNVLSAAVPVTVLPARAGDGNLLVRDNSSQLCTDCHAIQTHSSESAGTANGAWATTCRDCHTPHKTRNVYLVAEQITPPAIQSAQPARAVGFVKGGAGSGDSGAPGWDAANNRPAPTASFVNSDFSGPCQVCHTRTAHYRNAAGGTAHETGRCVDCHRHSAGFRFDESRGNVACGACHKFDMIAGGANAEASRTSTYHHVMEQDVTLTGGLTDYPSSATPAVGGTVDKTCTQCHADHNVFRSDINTGSTGRANNLRVSITANGLPRQNTASGPLTTPVAPGTTYTNVDVTVAGAGVCISCHTSAQAKDNAGGANQKSDGTTQTDAISQASFAASAHDYVVGNGTAARFSKDASSFQNNCVKCHNSDAVAKYQDGTFGFSLHSSPDRRLRGPLGRTTVPDDDSEDFCYRCHSKLGDAVGGTAKVTASRDWYGAAGAAMSAASEDVFTQMQKGTAGSPGGPTGTTRTLYFKPNTELAASSTGTVPTAHLATSDAFQGGTYAARAMAPTAPTVAYESQTTTTTTVSAGTQNWRRVAFISPPVTTGYTTAPSAWTLNVWDRESSTSANAQVRYAIYTIDSAAALKQTIVARTSSGTEMGNTTAPGTMQAIATAPAAAVPVAAGDRIVVDLEIQTVGVTTGGSYSMTYFFGSGAASNVVMPDTVTFNFTMPVVTAVGRHDVGAYSGLHRPSAGDETGAYIGANKHVECEDCHSPHAAKAGLHTQGSNVAGGALTGVDAVQPTMPTTNWANGTTMTFTQTTVGATTPEAYVCFKCHSSWNTAIPTSPATAATGAWATGGGGFTNTALEFSTANASYHPVLGALPATDPGANGSSRLNATQLINGWTPGQTMTCTDCHDSETGSAVAQGPHGSGIRYMLTGTQKAWPYTTAGATSGTLFTVDNSEAGINSSNGLFCRNCHPATNSTASNSLHTNGDLQGGQHGGDSTVTACVACHVRVPHGGKVSRLVVTTNAPARYRPVTPNMARFTKNSAYRSYSVTTNVGSSCSEHSSGASGGEAW